MPATAQDVIDTLESIDASLKLLVTHFGCVPQAAASPTSRAIPRIASDADLDSKYGDPFIRAKSPRDWTGYDQLGKPFSECPADYLDLIADRLDYFCSTETDEKKLKYQQLDASRARGWAARLRAGWKPPVTDAAVFPSDAAQMVSDDEVPF